MPGASAAEDEKEPVMMHIDCYEVRPLGLRTVAPSLTVAAALNGAQ
jgi:hypothetical protein